MDAPLRVMLVDDSASRLFVAEEALISGGFMIVAKLATNCDLATAVISLQPDVIFIDVDAPGRDVLESLRTMHGDSARPVVMCAAPNDVDGVRRAINAGMSAYVAAGTRPGHWQTVIELAMSRFELHRSVKNVRASGTTRDGLQRHAMST